MQEIKELKLMQSKLQKEFLEIKQKMFSQENSGEEESVGKAEISNNDNNYLLYLVEVTTRKWIINVTIKINNEFILKTTALFDTGADLNCIRKLFFQNILLELTVLLYSSNLLQY